MNEVIDKLMKYTKDNFIKIWDSLSTLSKNEIALKNEIDELREQIIQLTKIINEFKETK